VPAADRTSSVLGGLAGQEPRGPAPAISPPLGEAAARGGGDHSVVNLRRRQLRTLRRIERDLADSDPGLDALFRAFARHAARREVPRVEKMDYRPFRILARLRRGRSGTERMTDRCADNWNDP
jgi:hypothetical protein